MAAKISTRDFLRAKTEEEQEKLWAMISEALDATKLKWGYCPKCRSKVQADFPDNRVRFDAAKLLLENMPGKPKDVDPPPPPDPLAGLEDLSDDDLRRIAAGG